MLLDTNTYKASVKQDWRKVSGIWIWSLCAVYLFAFYTYNEFILSDKSSKQMAKGSKVNESQYPRISTAVYM